MDFKSHLKFINADKMVINFDIYLTIIKNNL